MGRRFLTVAVVAGLSLTVLVGVVFSLPPEKPENVVFFLLVVSLCLTTLGCLLATAAKKLLWRETVWGRAELRRWLLLSFIFSWWPVAAIALKIIQALNLTNLLLLTTLILALLYHLRRYGLN